MTSIEQSKNDAPVASLCDALDIPRASLYRARSRAQQPGAAAAPRPTPAHALNAIERQTVLDTLNSLIFIDLPPTQIYAKLLDDGKYLCSTRTMYRILKDNHQIRERRKIIDRSSFKKPELIATKPNQVWSWDITKLKGPVAWTYFYLYVIIDIFSRYVVGWLVADREAASLAKQLIDETCFRQSILPGQLTIHSDRGSPMKSKLVAQLYADLGIIKSFSRPSVSNDNPFSESQFKTMKYRPDFPGRFGCIEDATAFGRPFFGWYNNDHQHSGLGFYTPADVHFGRVDEKRTIRQATLDVAFDAHPERFRGKRPNAQKPPETVWINPPKRIIDNATDNVSTTDAIADGFADGIADGIVTGGFSMDVFCDETPTLASCLDANFQKDLSHST